MSDTRCGVVVHIAPDDCMHGVSILSYLELGDVGKKKNIVIS